METKEEIELSEKSLVKQSESEQIAEYPAYDFITGLLFGIIASVFSLYFLRYLRNTKRKREGLFLGCLLSFILFFFISLSLGCYSTYVNNIKKENAIRTERQMRLLPQESYWSFVGQSISEALSKDPPKSQLHLMYENSNASNKNGTQERRLRLAQSSNRHQVTHAKKRKLIL